MLLNVLKKQASQLQHFDRKNFDTKDTYEEAILDALREVGAEWLVLAGYMRLIGQPLVEGLSFAVSSISILPYCLRFQGKMRLDKRSNMA